MRRQLRYLAISQDCIILYTYIVVSLQVIYLYCRYRIIIKYQKFVGYQEYNVYNSVLISCGELFNYNLSEIMYTRLNQL